MIRSSRGTLVHLQVNIRDIWKVIEDMRQKSRLLCSSNIQVNFYQMWTTGSNKQNRYLEEVNCNTREQQTGIQDKMCIIIGFGNYLTRCYNLMNKSTGFGVRFPGDGEQVLAIPLFPYLHIGNNSAFTIWPLWGDRSNACDTPRRIVVTPSSFMLASRQIDMVKSQHRH